MTFAVLCPGQGGQHAGLFDLLSTTPGFTSDLDAALTRVRDIAGFDPRDVAGDARHPARLFDNAVAQPSICAVQSMTWSVLRPRLAAAGIAPRLFAGYSVGELAAYGCAGALAFDDLVTLAVRRAASMDAAARPGDGLVAVRGAFRADVDAACAVTGVHVAIVNGEDQFIVGGRAAGLASFASALVARGVTMQRLAVAVASHTLLLADAAAAFADDLSAARWMPGFVPVVAGIDGALVHAPSQAVDVLARQVARTVQWATCMDAVRERGVTVALEVGPGGALARLLAERHRDIAVRSVSDFRSIDAVVDWVVRAHR